MPKPFTLDEDAAQRVLLVQAFEAADPEGRLLPLAARASATDEARAAMGSASGPRAAALLLTKRAASLVAELDSRLPFLPALRRLGRLDLGLGLGLFALAAVFGFGTAGLGPERRFNLLALPIALLLAWHLGLYLLLLLAWARRGLFRPRPPGAWFGRAVGPALAAGSAGWLLRRALARLPAQAEIAAAALPAFLRAWRATAGSLLAARARRALHLGALGLMSGVLAGLYLRGLAFEYRASWESTFLEPKAAYTLVATVLAPAAWLLGTPVPGLAAFEAIRGPAGSGPAVPWVHLLAATAALVVLVPRLLLLMGENLRLLHLGRRVALDPRAPGLRHLLAGGALETISLSLVSHTNVGKTSLARTLLRRDVGEVLDREHVTDDNAAFGLIATPDAELRLWDTPGFGDSARLLARLRGRENPVGWLKSQVWDRWRDRAFWCSQQAVKNVADETDVVLYLVNAADPPDGARHIGSEMELLAFMGRPILLLLNQVGEVAPGSPAAAELERRWRHWAQDWPLIRDVLSLDAFSRCWVAEGLLFQAVERALPEPRRSTMAELAAAWERRNLEVFERAVDALGAYLADAATAREALPSIRPSKEDKAQAMERLATRLEAATNELMQALLAAHGLDGAASAPLTRRIDAFLVRGTTELTVKKGALWAGALSGALGGLAADLASGGLSFGGGMVVGAILGALGGAGLTRAHELVQEESGPAVDWSPAFLAELTEQALLRYLAVAHFGRGRGAFEDREQPEAWQAPVEAAVEERAAWLAELWSAGDRASLAPRLAAEVREMLVAILREAYPGALRAWERP